MNPLDLDTTINQVILILKCHLINVVLKYLKYWTKIEQKIIYTKRKIIYDKKLLSFETVPDV